MYLPPSVVRGFGNSTEEYAGHREATVIVHPKLREKQEKLADDRYNFSAVTVRPKGPSFDCSFFLFLFFADGTYQNLPPKYYVVQPFC